MFSASLIAMMIHSLPLEPKGSWFPPPSNKPRLPSGPSDAVADALMSTVDQFPSDWPSLPVVGKCKSGEDLSSISHSFSSHIDTAPGRDYGHFFWGRVPVDELIRHLHNNSSIPADQVFIDLGTPLRVAAPGQYNADCDNFLKSTVDPNVAKCCVAIVDTGDALSTVRKFGGKLAHAESPNLDLSVHAETVLYVMLERLNRKGLLPNVTVVCSLVEIKAPINLGLDCFKQDCAPELLDAVKALHTWLTNSSNYGPNSKPLPTLVNMSMGTHVGPHDGSSPLEDYISQTLTLSKERFLVAAAGNDGGRGFSAYRKLKASVQEFIHLRTGPRCKELLIEFWWDDSPAANMTIDAEVNEIQAGARNTLGTLTISSSGKSVLTARSVGLPTGMTASTMCLATKANMKCVAFALTSSSPLPSLEVAFSLEATRETIVRGWTVVAEKDPETSFMEGGQEGSVCVPACDPSAVGVAGVMDKGQMWQGTSRGPAGTYQVGSPDMQAPLMAHRPDGVGSTGTSIASPRTAADVTEVVIDAGRRGTCATATDLVLERYYPSTRHTSPPVWDSRFGYHKELSL